MGIHFVIRHSSFAALIDRLLASPLYGERWAQHWLDVARYADTGGMANDYERSNMWRYRDYARRTATIRSSSAGPSATA